MTILYSTTLFSNLDLCLISFLSAHPVFWHDLYECTQSLSPSLTIVYMLLLLSSPPLFLPSPPPHPYPHVSSQLTLRFVALNIVSVYQKDRSTGNDMFPPGVKRHTHTHMQKAHIEASETASSSQCNYGETEQSVTHLSAARIRAGVLLWHWWGKPGVSLLKHNDRQLHLLTWPRWQTKYLDWGETEEDRLWCRTWRWHCRAFHACESTNIFYKCMWTQYV